MCERPHPIRTEYLPNRAGDAQFTLDNLQWHLDAANERIVALEADNALLQTDNAEMQPLMEQLAGQAQRIAELEASADVMRRVRTFFDVATDEEALAAAKKDSEELYETEMRNATLSAQIGTADSLLRHEWWLRHGCSVVALYGDDGEMQCNAASCCMMDFKRADLAELERHVFKRRLESLAALGTAQDGAEGGGA